MKIVWAPNPLRTVVELDDADKRLLRERIKVDYLEECITSAHFDLDPKHREWLAGIGKSRTLEESVAEALRVLDFDYVVGEKERDGKTLDAWLDEQLASHVAELADVHYGDCTCTACSCLNCRAEELLGINTIGGLGKHSAYKIEAAFKPDGVTIEDAIRSFDNYYPRWTAGRGWSSEEDFQKHVPRWIEEARQAREWLDAYRREHFVPADSVGKATESQEKV